MTIQEIIDLLKSREREINTVIERTQSPMLRAQLNGHIAELQSLMNILGSKKERR